MRIDAEFVLSELLADLHQETHAGVVAMHLGSLAASQWDPYRRERDDWAAIYNMWLLLGECYRLRSLWHGTPAHTNLRGRRGSVVELLQYACFGIWCELWQTPTLAQTSREWCKQEQESLQDSPVGPSATLVDAFPTGTVRPDAAMGWATVRRNFNRGGLKRSPVHSDSFPFDVLAPELAWCDQLGQKVPACDAIIRFPARQAWPVTSVTERALVAIAMSRLA